MRKAKEPRPKGWYVRTERDGATVAFYCLRPQEALATAEKLRAEDLGRVWIEAFDGAIVTVDEVKQKMWRRG